MKKLAINKNIVLVLVLVVLAVAGYFIFFRSGEEPLTTTESSTASVGGQLVAELNRLTQLKNINGNIFNDEVFTSLVDVTQPITPQPLGRANPFLPLGAN